MPHTRPPRLPSPPPALARSLALAWAVLWLGGLVGAAGCSDMGSAAAPGAWDAGGGAGDASGQDGAQAADTSADGGAAWDVGPAEDSTGADTPADVRPDGVGKTDNPAPPAGPSRSHLALDGHRAAWVEVDASGGRALVTWDLDTPDAPPVSYTWPYLVQPKALVLAQGWLVFEDTPYNDPDIFALRLADGAVHGVVTRPGPQRHPAALPPPGDAPPGAAVRVAWEDCRDCLAGDVPRPEIYLRAVAAGSEEQRLTADEAADRAPCSGTLADGSPGLAWLSGESDAKVWVEGSGLTQTIPLPFPEAAGVALTRGMLASRPSPLIINPDSMTPSDVFLTDLTTLQTRRLSTHAELGAQDPAAPVAQAGRVAWVEAIVGASPSAREVVVVAVDDPSVELLRAPLTGVTGIAVSGAWLGATVPASGEQTDVWFQATP